MKFSHLLYILFLLPFSLSAQEKTELDEVVVTDNRIQLSISESSRNIAIITKKEIAALPVQNLNELIQNVAGVDVRQRGAWGMQADVSVRGGTFEQTLVLLNGIKVNDPQTGHHNLNLGVDLESIERIEIIKGPAASRYGLNSFSGVINIVTNPSSENEGSANIAVMQSAGSDPLEERNSGYAVTGNAQFGKEKFRNSVSINRTQSTGYRSNTDFLRHQLMYQGALSTKFGDFGAMASYLDNAFGASGFYAYPLDTNSVESVRTRLIALTYKKNFKKFSLNTKAYWRNNFDEYIFIRQNPTAFRNRHTTNVLGAESHLTYSYKYGKAGIGLEARNESIKSNNLGERSRLNLGVFAENRTWLLKNKLNIGQGMYINQSSDFGVQYLPTLDANYLFDKGFSVFANYGTSFRVPSFTDLYYVSRTNIGNADLKPEQAINYELGAKWIEGEHQLQTSVFIQESTNLIDWVRDNDTLAWQPENYESATSQGIDVNYKWTNLSSEINALYLQSFNLSYTYLDITLNGKDAVLSRYSLNHLNHQLSAQFTMAYKDKFSLTTSGKYFDRITYKSYWLVDTRFKYTADFGDLYFDCNNVLNTEYIEAAQAPLPGRWIRLGIKIKI